MGLVTAENVKNIVSYHQPTGQEIDRISAIREATERMITTILLYVPDCADRSAAIRHVREAMMTAIAAIVLGGLI